MTEKTLINVLSGWTSIFNDDPDEDRIQCDLADYLDKCPECERQTHTDSQGWYCHCGAYGDRTGKFNPKF